MKHADAVLHSEITTAALEWLVRLNDTDSDPEEPYPDIDERRRAFLEWAHTSPMHVRAFLEAMELEQRVNYLDPRREIQLEKLLEISQANVVALHQPGTAIVATRSLFSNRRRKHVSVAIAAAAGVITALYLLLSPGSSRSFATDIGEQRTCKLQDGSIVILNTDTRIEVNFSDQRRDVRLTDGEALFIVARDPNRPFTVDAGDTQVRAIGTQFDVRRRAHSTVVAVVEGSVQVSTQTKMKTAMSKLAVPGQKSAEPSSASLRLAAGEKAHITNGEITPTPSHDDVLSWRQRRLVFRDTPLAEVADEFNRYNRVQIQVEDPAAGSMQITGTFDADHPQALLLFAQNHHSLLTEVAGERWVIRSR